MGKIIAFANQKGGVGKTTTMVNLSAALAYRTGKKVLLVDSDPQGNATSGVGVNKREIKYSIYDVLIGKVTAEEAIVPTNPSFEHRSRRGGNRTRGYGKQSASFKAGSREGTKQV